MEVTNTAGQSVQTMDLGTGAEEIAVERSYDSRHNLVAEVYGDGSRIEYTYDGQDRMTGKTCSGETGEVESMIVFEYTDYGELARVQRKNPSGENLCTIDYTYDGFGREKAVTQTIGRQSPQTVRYTYDADGNRTEIHGEVPEGGRVSEWEKEIDNSVWQFATMQCSCLTLRSQYVCS